ncbi:MAG TPA: DUF2779 domain-containing protein [Pyrinomonadaceae bacterium]|nr:DUF2779 domain-containing protein [Pyrinomonadaceae bacterium]
MLTKSAYQEFLRCPQEYRLQHTSPELFKGELTLQDKHLREQGYEVQRWTRELDIFDLDPEQFTVEFEREFATGHLYAKADIVVTDIAGAAVSIYEVKSSSKVKREHITDVAFQKTVAEALGLTVSRVFVITLDPTYTRNGHLNAQELFTVHDVTGDVSAMQAETLLTIKNAFNFLMAAPSKPSLLDHCGSKLECKFIQHNFTDLPDYSVFNISRIAAPKLRDLIEQDVIDIRHVPADFKLSDKQRLQVDVACCGEKHIETERIRGELGQLRFPLRFLDYETFSYAVPLFSGIKPFQQLVFQYSLHTVTTAGVESKHAFHLSRNDGEHPAREIAESLSAVMADDIGTVIAWHASFEKERNSELGAMFPEFGEFFNEVNASVFDLETIFTQQLYVDAGFRGRTSIKSVLPVLCPQHSYKDLAISDGGSASINWYHMATKRYPEEHCARIYEALCKYCHLDTLAMVDIYDLLMAI